MKSSLVKRLVRSLFRVLFLRHKKHLPKVLEGSFVGEFCRYGICIFFSAWLFQGVHYMNWREVVVKVLFDLFFVGVFWFLLPLGLFVSFVLAHSLNFIFNGQFIAMFTHMGVHDSCAGDVSGRMAEKFLCETKALHDRLSNRKFIDAAIAYGSLSRGCYRFTSDIDIRFVPAKNRYWICCFYALVERCICFVRGYPLDLYVFGYDELIKKMRSDELPVMFVERKYGDVGCMRRVYPQRVEYADFVNVFSDVNLK